MNTAKEEILNCTFKPKLTKHTIELANNKYLKKSMSKSSLDEKFQFLFEDAKKRLYTKNHAENTELTHLCTFKPDIECTQRITKGNYSAKKRVRKTTKENIKQLHKPTTGRGPKIERNKEKIPIGEYLYVRP